MAFSIPVLSKFDFKIPKIFHSRLFIAILLAKILFSFIFASNLMADGFVPFVKYFVESGFQNPYQHFADIGMPKAFPYPTMMLLALSIPYLLFFVFPQAVSSSLSLDLFLIRVPVILADMFIFYVLVRWLKTNEEKALKYYWASPIVFYICYFHGQLDAIPTALLVLSLVFIFKGESLLSAILLGMGIAAKTNIFLSLPFIAIFVWKNYSLREAVKYSIISLAAFAILVLPFALSPGFGAMVFQASESLRLFDFAIPFNFQHLMFLAAPAALLVMLFTVSSYEKMNRDALMMVLALVFTLVVTLVPPEPGWYFWAIPFLIYFFVKQGKFPSLVFWSMNAFYILYFIFSEKSDFFQSFQLLAPQMDYAPNMHAMLQGLGINATLVSNLLFTFLSATLLMLAYWVYDRGVKSNLEYRKKERPVIIGIGGDSGTGKTQTSELLRELLGPGNSLIVNGDDMHKWERGDKHWSVFTHLNPEANKLHEELQQAIALAEGEKIERVAYDHSTGRFTQPMDMEPGKFVMFVGLHPFYLKKMRDLQDIKIFMDPEEELKLHWKIMRDVKARGYTKAQVLEQVGKRKDDRNKFIEPQKQFADIIVKYSLEHKIAQVGEPDAKVGKYLKITLDNSVGLEPLVSMLSKSGTLEIKAYPESDLKMQSVEFHGSVGAAELEKSLYSIVPNVEDLINNEEMKLRSGYDGLLQLFFIYYLSEISKFKVRK